MFDRKKKKKSEGEEKERLKSQSVVEASTSSTASGHSGQSGHRVTLTKAEESFFKMQEKRKAERILEKAKKSHKKRVEEFNAHLDSLSEHYDIPKVSWTK